MNERCRHKDCIYLKICMAFFDKVECSSYETTGTIPVGLVAVGPIDLQQDLFPRNEGIEIGTGKIKQHRKQVDTNAR